MSLIAWSEPALRARNIEKLQGSPPPPILEYVTFGHKRGISAALWLQLLTWYGGKIMTQETKGQLVGSADILYLQRQARMIIRMDPDFSDPYSFAALVLIWYAGAPHAALPFLEAAMVQFPEVWEYPFYYGFIHYRFLEDPRVAAQFFLRAGRLPRAPAFVPLLGAKLLRQEDSTADALETLRELLALQLPDKVRQEVEKEIVTLEAIQAVERVAALYAERFGKRPGEMDDLVRAGFFSAVPVDPSGNPLVIEADGRVTVAGRVKH